MFYLCVKCIVIPRRLPSFLPSFPFLSFLSFVQFLHGVSPSLALTFISLLLWFGEGVTFQEAQVKASCMTMSLLFTRKVKIKKNMYDFL